VVLSRELARSLLPEDQRLLNQTLIVHALIDSERPSHLQLTELGQTIQTIRRTSQVPGPRERRPRSEAQKKNPLLTDVRAGSRTRHLERVTGIEPASTAWEPDQPRLVRALTCASLASWLPVIAPC
jgi:hypothetical protein